MGERNDLIERLEEATLQWLELRDEENAALAQEASDAIASLTAALAEAEKKGAEAERRLKTVREHAFDEALKFIASRAHAALASRHRDISEGGQP